MKDSNSGGTGGGVGVTGLLQVAFIVLKLCTIRERYNVSGYESVVEMMHSWGEEEYPLARIAFKCFCHEEPEEIGKMWENNRQIALYSDEARRKDELISELIDRSGAL